MALQSVGTVRGHPVEWDQRTGRVRVKTYGFMTGGWNTLAHGASSAVIALELADAFLRRQ